MSQSDTCRLGKLITDDSVLYLDENKKRTRQWFQACGIQVPLGETKFGFIRSISQKADSVKDNTPNSPKFSERDSDERLDKLLEELLPDLILCIESKKTNKLP